MDPVTAAFAVAAAVAVFAIAAGVVGREAHRLDAMAPKAVYHVEDAVAFVSDRLPPATQARLTPDEVERLLTLHLRWLHGRGLQPANIDEHRQDIDETTVISDETLIGYLLGEAEREGVELLDDVDAVAVVDAHLAYFDAIGAVGPRAPGDDVL